VAVPVLAKAVDPAGAMQRRGLERHSCYDALLPEMVLNKLNEERRTAAW